MRYCRGVFAVVLAAFCFSIHACARPRFTPGRSQSTSWPMMPGCFTVFGAFLGFIPMRSCYRFSSIEVNQQTVIYAGLQSDLPVHLYLLIVIPVFKGGIDYVSYAWFYISDINLERRLVS